MKTLDKTMWGYWSVNPYGKIAKWLHFKNIYFKAVLLWVDPMCSFKLSAHTHEHVKIQTTTNKLNTIPGVEILLPKIQDRIPEHN